jgi:hypothetical protein
VPGPLRFFGPSAAFYGSTLSQVAFYSPIGVEPASGAIAGTVVLVAAAVEVFPADGAIAGTVTISAAGQVELFVPGTGSITVDVSLVAQGSEAVPGVAGASFDVTLGAEAEVFYPGAGAGAFTVELTGEASAALPGSGALVAGADLAAQGTLVFPATGAIAVGVSLVASTRMATYFFTPPVLDDGPPIAYRDRSARQDGTVTNEWLVRQENPTGFRLMSFYRERPQGVAVYKMSDGSYRTDRPVPGFGAKTAWPPVPIDAQVNGAISQSWLYSRLERELVQDPAVVLVYYGGSTYQVTPDEADALEDGGLGEYVTEVGG